MGHEAAVLKSITGETMALTRVAAKGNVNGLLFELSVEQRNRNPSAANIEAVYAFPLPSSAVLLDFDVTLGDKQFNGVVVERKAAEAQYEEAIDQGDTAILRKVACSRTRCRSAILWSSIRSHCRWTFMARLPPDD